MPLPAQIIVFQLSHLIQTPKHPTVIDVYIDDGFSLDPRLNPTVFQHLCKQPLQKLTNICKAAVLA